MRTDIPKNIPKDFSLNRATQIPLVSDSIKDRRVMAIYRYAVNTFENIKMWPIDIKTIITQIEKENPGKAFTLDVNHLLNGNDELRILILE